MIRVKALAAVAALALAGAPAVATASVPGPFATLAFSRTETHAADNCIKNDANIATLLGTVEPYLQSKGLTASGSVNTLTTGSNPYCTHYSDSLSASRSELDQLSADGWTFFPHIEGDVANFTAAQDQSETCGQVQTLNLWGLAGGNGQIDYPGAQNGSPAETALQTNYGSTCADWGRQYDPDSKGITTLADGSTVPYWQYTMAVNGGPCADSTMPCYNVVPLTGNARYVQPQTVINTIDSLQPGQWLSIQAYVLVTGTNPAYSSNQEQWNCTGLTKDHWTNDNERYCYTDWQKIVAALVAKGITVTDPHTVGVAFGRP